jgi:hypothetical protein
MCYSWSAAVLTVVCFALALGLALKRLEGLLRPMFLIGLNLVLRGWWLSRLVNASWHGISLTSKTGPTTDVFFSDDIEEYVYLAVAVMVVCSITFVCILLVFYCLYAYQFFIIMFMPYGLVRR